jgi:predicted phosphodiesterase
MDMKAIRCDLPYAEKIEIHPMADLHIGDMSCDFNGIMERIEYIKNTPNAYCVLDGDLMDTAICTSVGDTYGANLQPMEQLKQCVKIFEPIKDKILCVLPGNHENRVYKSDGLDITELMCAQLGIPEKYSPTTALLFIRFGKQSSHKHNRPHLYTAYVTHGSGGGRKEGGKVNRLADLASIVDADIYIHAHTHLPLVFKESFFRVSGSNSSVALVDKLFVNTAASLNYGGYGDRQGFKPASKRSPVIYLDGLKHDMWAKL